MVQRVKDRAAYRRVIAAFKKERAGITVADVAARTGLPLGTARELVPRAADEFNGRLEVTESAEIRYSFPRGFTSRYRGFRPALGRFLEKAGGIAKTAGVFLFKGWIMVMLVGYFALFMLIALGAVLLSMAAQSRDSNGRSRGNGLGGLYLGTRIFDLIIRLWFYSELTRSLDGRPRRASGKKKAPLHRAIFSFVFGDGDPNRGWEETEKKALIAYLQSHRGVISLAEYMVITGRPPLEAEGALMAFCAEFNGSPEATEEGTVVYRFDELLLRADRRNRSFEGASAPLKRLKTFSQNDPKANRWFALINGVNLVFGAYFLWHALSTGLPPPVPPGAVSSAPLIYTFALNLVYQFTGQNPLPLVAVGLGIVPLAFSLFFWLIPALRALFQRGENEGLKNENYRKLGYGRIWSFPGAVKAGDLGGGPLGDRPECRPQNPAAAADRVLKDMGAIAVPEVSIDPAGSTVYSFTELEREKAALEKYRSGIDPAASALGKTIFDSGGGAS
jgi:hypothetical protein